MAPSLTPRFFAHVFIALLTVFAQITTGSKGDPKVYLDQPKCARTSCLNPLYLNTCADNLYDVECSCKTASLLQQDARCIGAKCPWNEVLEVYNIGLAGCLGGLTISQQRWIEEANIGRDSGFTYPTSSDRHPVPSHMPPKIIPASPGQASPHGGNRSPSKNNDSSDEISTTAIAGIVLGVACALVGIVVFIWTICRHNLKKRMRAQRNAKPEMGFLGNVLNKDAPPPYTEH